MAKLDIPHKSKCFACEEKRKRMHLAVDITTFKTYCASPLKCGRPKYRPQDRNLVPLDYEELSQRILADYPEPLATTLVHRLGNPYSLRISPMLINFLFRYGEKHRIKSLNAAILDILEEAMNRNISLDDEDNLLEADHVWGVPRRVSRKVVSKPRKVLPEEVEEKEEDVSSETTNLPKVDNGGSVMNLWLED